MTFKLAVCILTCILTCTSVLAKELAKLNSNAIESGKRKHLNKGIYKADILLLSTWGKCSRKY